jgi:homoserine kinase type II
MSYDVRLELDIQEIINKYDLGEVRNVRKAEGGTVNENWIVSTATSTVVVRGVSKSLSLNDILFEHSFVTALERNGFPYYLPKALRTRSGRSVVAINGRHVWLYNYIEGSNSRLPRDTVLPQMARAQAAAHKTARFFSLRRTKSTPIALEHPRPLHSLRGLQLKVADNQGDHHRFFAAHVQECIGILEQFRCTPYNTLPRLPIHGDMCGENLIFSSERLCGVIDFDHCCLDTAIRDIAIGLRYECWSEEDGYRLDYQAARYFLESYHEITPLTRMEIELIPGIVIAELADLFRWRIVEIKTKQVATGPVAELENLFKAIRWYHRHQKDIARALRM